MMKANVTTIGLLLVCVSFLYTGLVSADMESVSVGDLEREQAVFQKWRNTNPNKIPVIVELVAANKVLHNENAADRAFRQSKADRIFKEIGGRFNNKILEKEVRRFRDPAFRSMLVSESELAVLLRNPDIRVFPNEIHTVALNQSVPLIFSNQGTADFDGTGQKVVVIDTGVENNHSFLTGAVDTASAACFSNNEGNGIAGHMPASESLCPGSMPQVISAVAGKACSSSLQGCQHGTQMAGIIAGADINQTGVAVGSQVIPIQVFTKINDFDVCNSLGLSDPCIGAVTEDVLEALIYVRDSLLPSGVAAVNISFGTSAAQQGQCESALETVINQIVSTGTAVISSSGNGGSTVAMSSPACIDSVVSVASTNLMDNSSTFNNSNSELDLFAPGEGISSSTLPLSQFADVQDVPSGGTSASAAHVSGAWAVLKSKNSSLNVQDLLAVLKSSGEIVTNVSAGVTAKRIDLKSALDSIVELEQEDEVCIPIKAQNGKIALICL